MGKYLSVKILKYEIGLKITSYEFYYFPHGIRWDMKNRERLDMDSGMAEVWRDRILEWQDGIEGSGR